MGELEHDYYSIAVNSMSVSNACSACFFNCQRILFIECQYFWAQLVMDVLGGVHVGYR